MRYASKCMPVLARRRTHLCVWLVILLFSSLLFVSKANAAPPNGSAQLPDPASLTAPDASDPIVMACSDRQVDLNHADQAALQALPTPDGSNLSQPVANNIIAGRPYLQPTDLRTPAVEGVTDDHVIRWIANQLVCVTPIFEPASDGTQVPVAPDVCEPGQYDINDDADHAMFVKLFGGPTADRLVAGAPYPSVINSLRRAGVGAGRISKHGDKLCATPYPVSFAGTDWAWADPEEGITVDTIGTLGTYDLTVPAGTTTGNGSWASITEVDSPFDELAEVGLSLDLPAANPHIHGPWVGAVGITLPRDNTNVPQEWPHGVLHWTNQTVEIHGGSAAPAEPDGRVTVATDDLSIFSAFRAAANFLPDGVQPFFGFIENVVRGLLGSGGQVRCSPDHTGQTLNGGERLDVNGDLLQPLPFTPPVNHCVTRHGETLDVKLGNGRGNVQRVTDWDGVQIHDVGFGGSGIWGSIAYALNNRALGNGGTLHLAPGTSLSAHTTAYQGTLTYSTDVTGSLFSTALYTIAEELSSFLPLPLIEVIFQFPNCATGVITAFADIVTGETQALTAILSMFTTALECVRVSATTVLDPDLAQKWLTPDYAGVFKARGTIDRYLKIAKVGKIALAIADAAQMSGANGTVTVRYRSPEPPSPTTDSKGRPVFTDCVVKSFSYENGWTNYVDATCQDLAYGDVPDQPTPPSNGPPVDAFNDWDGLITSQRMYNLLRRDASGVLHLILMENGELVAHPIGAGDEWSFKEDWPEHEWRSAEFNDLINRRGSPAVNDPLRLRYYTEGRGGNWLLRLGNGTTYWIDSNGIRRLVAGVEQQQKLANTVLTLHPAQYANDVCPYRTQGQTGIIVC